MKISAETNAAIKAAIALKPQAERAELTKRHKALTAQEQGEAFLDELDDLRKLSEIKADITRAIAQKPEAEQAELTKRLNRIKNATDADAFLQELNGN